MIWHWILFLFGMSIFVSKSGLSFFALLAVIFSFFKTDFRKIWQEHRSLVLVALLYPILFFLNLFSLDGLASSLTLLHAWAWPLVVFPALLIFQGEKDDRKNGEKEKKYFFAGAFVGLFIALGYSVYFLGSTYQFDLSTMDRLMSFWDSGRWGVFLGVACLWLIGVTGTKFFQEQPFRAQLIWWGFLLFAVVAFILSKTRGPLIGFFAGCLLLLLDSRVRKIVFLSLAVSFLVIWAAPNMKDRVVSIVDIQKTEKGEITATQASNSARLHIWKVALDFFWEQPFFGTGFDATRKPLTKFVEKQSEEYRQAYAGGEYSFSDQHSSYLNFLVQNGILFSLLMWSVFLFITVKGALLFWRTRGPGILTALSVLLFYYIVFFFYATLQSFDSVFFFMALAYIGSHRA